MTEITNRPVPSKVFDRVKVEHTDGVIGLLYDKPLTMSSGEVTIYIDRNLPPRTQDSWLRYILTHIVLMKTVGMQDDHDRDIWMIKQGVCPQEVPFCPGG